MALEARKRTRSPKTAPYANTAISNAAVKGIETLGRTGMKNHLPTALIDTIISKYAGKAVPLDVAFPDAPEGTARLPANTSVGDAGPFAAVGYAALTEAAYVRERQLKMMNRMLVRDASMTDIARALGISLDACARLRTELFQRMKDEQSRVDGALHVAEAVGFFNEVRATGMRMSDAAPQGQPAIPMVNRQRGLAIALAAQDKKGNFLRMVGLYDTPLVRPSREEAIAEDNELSRIMGMFNALLDPQAYEDNTRSMLDVTPQDVVTRDPSRDIKVL